MDATAMTIISQLITDARSRFGAGNVEAIAVEGSLFDQTLEHVLALGGEVSLDSCVVDGVTVRELDDGGSTPQVFLADAEAPQPLLPREQD